MIWDPISSRGLKTLVGQTRQTACDHSDESDVYLFQLSDRLCVPSNISWMVGGEKREREAQDRQRKRS